MIRPDCIEVYPDRAAWLAARREVCGHCLSPTCREAPPLPRIGASDIGKILGKSPHGGAWDVWLDKRQGRADADTDDMAAGRRWEPVVCAHYAEDTGAVILAHEGNGLVLVRHPEHAWATCSPDAFIADKDGVCGGLEAKAVLDFGSAAGWGEETQIVEPGVFERTAPWPAPLHYVLQVYWSLAVTGLPFWDLAAILMPRRGRLVYHRFLADPEFQDALLAQVGAWRERHLVGGEEPPVDDSAAAWSYYAGLPHEAPLREATPEEAALARALHAAQQTRAGAEEMERMLKNQLAARLADVKGVALGPAVGRKKPPRIAWEGGGERREEARPARSYTVAPHLRIRGITEEE